MGTSGYRLLRASTRQHRRHRPRHLVFFLGLCSAPANAISDIHHSPIITLTPTHLGIHPLLSDAATTIPWDKQPRIEGIEQVKTTYDSYNLLHVSARDIEGTLRLDTMGLPLRFWQLKRIINHFNTHPEDRAILGTSGGIDLVAEIITAGGSA